MLAFVLFIDGPSNDSSIMMMGPMVAAIVKY